MTTTGKVVATLSAVAAAALIGWAIYESTKNKVSSGSAGSADTSDASEKPPVTIVSDTKNPDGSMTRLFSDGTKKTYTKAEVEAGKKAIAGRGADGTWNP